jgi:hypothetical protein
MNSLLSLIVVGLALATLFFFVNKNNQATNKKIEMLEDYRQEKFKKLENINDSDFLAPDNKNQFEVKASEEIGKNETYKVIDAQVSDTNNSFNLNDNQVPNDCFPKDQLNPAELLPADANSVWAQVNPNGQGELGDQNFLNAGYHVGINTVGSSMRNANLGLRSEPPNPQVAVGPWMQSTIQPDLMRRGLEVGK